MLSFAMEINTLHPPGHFLVAFVIGTKYRGPKQLREERTCSSSLREDEQDPEKSLDTEIMGSTVCCLTHSLTCTSLALVCNPGPHAQL